VAQCRHALARAADVSSGQPPGPVEWGPSSRWGHWRGSRE
jgi:hypothetical protein